MTLALLALSAVLSGCATGTTVSSADAGQDPPKSQSGFDNVPEGVHVLLKRDGIPAIWNPVFVSADEANMPDDAKVIGVSFNGDSRAYSINLLDGHEIVNDVVGGRKIAVTW